MRKIIINFIIFNSTLVFNISGMAGDLAGFDEGLHIIPRPLMDSMLQKEIAQCIIKYPKAIQGIINLLNFNPATATVNLKRSSEWKILTPKECRLFRKSLLETIEGFSSNPSYVTVLPLLKNTGIFYALTMLIKEKETREKENEELKQILQTKKTSLTIETITRVQEFILTQEYVSEPRGKRKMETNDIVDENNKTPTTIDELIGLLEKHAQGASQQSYDQNNTLECRKKNSNFYPFQPFWNVVRWCKEFLWERKYK